MMADELLRLHPRETLRWLRRRLGRSQLDLALEIGVGPTTLGSWEARRHGISDVPRAQLLALLAPQLATAEGVAFVRSLGHGDEARDQEGG